MPTRDHDHIGCFADQVKLTRALVRDLDEAVKEVNLLGEHEEESNQRITEMEALCKRLREDAQMLNEENTLEGMIQSRDELILEMAKEYRLNRMGENNDDEDDDLLRHRCPLSRLRRSSKKTPWRMVHRSWMIWMTWVIWTMIQMKAALTWMSGFPMMGVMI